MDDEEVIVHLAGENVTPYTCGIDRDRIRWIEGRPLDLWTYNKEIVNCFDCLAAIPGSWERIEKHIEEDLKL